MRGISVPIARSGCLPEEEDEGSILDEVQRNPAAFERLYDRYLVRVYRYVSARVGNSVDAEDITSQVFVAALESLPRYRHRGQFGAWLFSIARAKTADFHRRGDARRMLPLEEDQAILPDLLRVIMENERIREVAAILSTLEEEERELLRLRFAAGLNFESIATILKHKPSAIKMTLYRLLERIQKKLEVEND